MAFKHAALDKPVLVVGATGKHGSTGAAVAEFLRGREIPVRLLVRSESVAPPNDADAVVVGDLHDRGSLIPALDGVGAAYFTYPVAAGIVDAAANFASAARETALPHLVVMSMAAASPTSPSKLGRSQWLAEEVFDWAELAAINLRVAAFFFENLELLHGQEIRSEGVIRNSFGDARVSWISGKDAARIAVAALLHPERFNDRCIYPTGATVASHADIARQLSTRLGREIRHETVPAAAWQARLEKLATTNRRVNSAMAQHIASLGAAIRTDQQPNDLAEELIGAPPLAIADAIDSGDVLI